MSEARDLEKFHAWLLSRGREEGTADVYSADVRQALRCSSVTDRVLDRDLAPKTRRRIVASLRAWANFQKDGDLLITLKDLRLPPPKRKTVRKPLEEDVWFDLTDAIRADVHLKPAVKAVLLIMCVRGLRVGDVLRMRRGEVEQAIHTGRLMFEAKGGHTQDFTAKPMLEGLELLDEVGGKWERVEDLIAPRAIKIRKAARKRVHTALRRVAKKVGLDPKAIYPHRLRRTYVVQFLRALKGDPEALQKLISQMQWLNPNTAFEYTDFISRESLDEVDERIRRKVPSSSDIAAELDTAYAKAQARKGKKKE